MFSRTAPLRRELVRVFAERPFAVRFWDGTAVAATVPDSPTFIINSPVALAHLLRRPGELGLGRAYVSGHIDVATEDLEPAIALVMEWQPPAIRPADAARLAWAAVQACGLQKPPAIPSIELRQRGKLHSLLRDKSAVRHHYDAGNDFFALFLDESMTYSCAIWSRGATTLEEAQRTKLDLICTKLGLQEGERMLDIGCGWGALAIHAASNYGVSVLGITLSEPQASLARERVKAAGLSDRIEIRVADYRELDEPPFDKIASVGMVEHVGHTHLHEYTRAVSRVLKPGGRVLNQGIAQVRYDPADPYDSAGPISERYIFPDGDVPPLSVVLTAFEHNGFVSEHIEGFGGDYATTLDHWATRLDDAIRIAGRERVRIWRVYLRAGLLGFATGSESLYQVLLRKPDGERVGERAPRVDQGKPRRNSPSARAASTLG